MCIKISRLIEIFFVWGVVGGVIFSLFGAMQAVQGSPVPEDEGSDNSLVLVQGNSVFYNIEHFYPAPVKTVNLKKINVAITAYSSCPTETDGDPFITASGEWVRDGIVAANFLAFGTELKIPELYGEKVFIVKDRMHPRKTYQVDIWFPSKQEAVEFGAHYTYVELVGT